MDAVGDVYPPVHTLYNRGKTSDEGLTQMCFYGIGAHRLFREHMPTSPDGVARGDWVVRTNMLAKLPVREGLDSCQPAGDMTIYGCHNIVACTPSPHRSRAAPCAQTEATAISITRLGGSPR